MNCDREFKFRSCVFTKNNDEKPVFIALLQRRIYFPTFNYILQMILSFLEQRQSKPNMKKQADESNRI